MLKEGQEILDGRFKAVKKLGAGAFGEIFKVEKKKTGEMFAAKIVSLLLFNPLWKFITILTIIFHSTFLFCK